MRYPMSHSQILKYIKSEIKRLEKYKADAVMKKLFDEGHKIWIYSGRATEEILGKLKEHFQVEQDELPVHRINELVIKSFEEYKTPSGKPYFDILIDNRTVNPMGKDETVLYDTIIDTAKNQNRHPHVESSDMGFVVRLL